MKNEFYPLPEFPVWDNIEVSPVIELEDNVCEVCDEGQESFWSVYVHMVEGGVQCIADLPTKELAVKFAEMLQLAVDHNVYNLIKGGRAWKEVHYEVVAHLTSTVETEGSMANTTRDTQGSNGLYALADELTNKFTNAFKYTNWNDSTSNNFRGDFLDIISHWLTEKELVEG